MTELPGRVSGFSPLPCPGTPAASPQRRLPCRDELLTGPKTACLMLCQARHGAAGTLAASWPTPCITGLNPFYPSFSSPLFLSPPFSFSSASGLLCKAFPSRDVGVLSSTDVSESYLNNLMSWREMLLSVAEDPGALLWPHLGRVPHLWNTETHYVESNLSSLSQITADSCWDSLRDGDSGFTIHNNFLVPFNYIPIDDIMHNDKKNPQKKVTIYHTYVKQATVF